MSESSQPPTPTDDPIVVRTRVEYLPDQSDPTRQRYVFAYRVLISNESNTPVQLISRYWLITDGNGEPREVRGKGVVGEQPVIEPGETYVYTSGAVSETEVATMQGHYVMQRGEGQTFKADIPVFTLAVPNRVN